MQAAANPVTIIHFQLTGDAIRLTPEHSADSGIIQAAMQVCAGIERTTQVPDYFCLAQVRFEQEGQNYAPSAWQNVLAQALRRLVMTSKWLMGQLGTSIPELQSMPIDQFVEVYLEDDKYQRILGSWIRSRAGQISEENQNRKDQK